MVNQALRAHIDSTGVVEQALAALSNLCLDVEARLVVVKEGCLPQLREVIMKHKYHPGLQQACCDLIANLAASPENQASLVTEGCMEFILEAQRNFSGDPGNPRIRAPSS